MKDKMIQNSKQKMDNENLFSLLINNSMKAKKYKSKTTNSFFPILLFIINFQHIFPKCGDYNQEITIKTTSSIDLSYLKNLLSNLNINCIDIREEEYTYILKNNTPVESYGMFKGKDFITEIDLSKYDTSSFKSFDAMFLDCKSLTSINFGNCKTSLVTIMNSMFNGCSSLKWLDLSCFDTSKVTSMGNLFNDCKLLSSLDLSSFNTSKVIFFDNMFNNCGSLTSLNLSNFEMTNVENLENMFKDCVNLKYINLQRAHIQEGIVNINGVFEGIHNENFVINIDENSKLLDSIEVNNKKNCSIIISSSGYNPKDNLLFINNQTKLCTYNCNELQLYKYEYEGHCYEQYPKNNMVTTYIEKNIITEKIIKLESTEIFYNNSKTENNKENNNIIITTDIINNSDNKTIDCEMVDFILNKCDKNFFNEEDKYLFKKEIIASIQNGSLSEILTEVIQNGTNLIIQNEKELYQISTLSNQIKINNISFLNFTKCEEILKEKNIIKENED